MQKEQMTDKKRAMDVLTAKWNPACTQE